MSYTNNPGTGTNPIGHQNYVGMPNLGTQLINPDGSVAFVWYQLFQRMWGKLFGTTPNSISLAEAVDIQANVTQLQTQVGNVTLGTTTGLAHAGVGGVPPAQVATYLRIQVGTTAYVIPMYLP